MYKENANRTWQALTDLDTIRRNAINDLRDMTSRDLIELRNELTSLADRIDAIAGDEYNCETMPMRNELNSLADRIDAIAADEYNCETYGEVA